MKKLKVVLTLLLALCCSLCMFACGGGEKNISEVVLEGQKENFNEGDDFSVGELKVYVYYQGDDERHELKAEDYEIDSSAYDKTQAGQYIIYVIPKNQPKELWDGTEGGKDNRVKKSYYASVDHSWTESTDGKYQYECKCGAKRNSYTGLEDKISTKAWGNPATLTKGGEGKTYGDGVKAPIAGENHVSYGSLVAGQSLTLTLQITGLTRNDTPGAASAWDSPLMGIRNGAVGVLPREDGWIIGSAAGYQVPAECNIPVGGGAAAAGIATKDSPLWQVMTDGTSWSAGTAFPNDAANPTKWSTVVVEYIYQTDGVMLMRHTLNKFDGTKTVYTISVNLPRTAYEVCAYGEFCDYTVTAVEFVAGLAIEKYEVTAQPTNLVQPAGKLFDTTGLKTKATFSDKSTLDDNFNAYAYRNIIPEGGTEEDAVKTRVTLSNTPLTADMYDFFVEFNGMEAELSKDIKVIATPVTGANATEIRHVKEDVTTSFEAPDVAYDYAVTADKTYIRLTMTGAPAKATAAQTAVLGEGYTHFIAFKLLTNLGKDDFDTVVPGTLDKAVVAVCNKVDTTVDFVVGLQDGFKPFDVTLKKGETEVSKVQIDLSGLAALPAAGAEITNVDFTLDAGGTYTVKYTGLSNVDSLTLATGNARATVADVKKAITGTYTAGATFEKDKFYRASNTLYIVGLTSDANSVTVTYWLAAPELVNLTSARMSTAVSIRNGDTELASASLVYRLAVSSSAINIGDKSDPVYVAVSGNKLLVYAFTETTNIADGYSFEAFLNVEHPYAAGYKMNYGVGVSISGGDAIWLDENALTSGESVAKLITVGTVNNTTDYDKGVILVGSLNLPEIGTRKDDTKAVFHFTANEDTDKGQDKYVIYTVTGNTITKADKTPTGSRVEVQKGSCVTDDVHAYKDGEFYYGALIVPATGAHEFPAYAEGASTVTCGKCGAVKTKVVDGTTTYEYTILSEDNMSAFTNTATDGWWGADNKIGAQHIGAGNFAIKYVWDQLDANYCADGAIVFGSTSTEDTDIRKRFLEPATDQAYGALEAGKGLIGKDGKVEYEILDKDGKKVTFDKDFAALDNGKWLGNYEVTAARLGTTLYVYEKVVTKVDGGDSRTFTSKLVITNFTTEALEVCLWGNPYWCGLDTKVNVGVVTAQYAATPWVYGAGNKTVFVDWFDAPDVTLGHSVTITGKVLAAGAQAWESIYCEMKQGATLRADNYGWSFGDNLFGTFAGGEQTSVPSTNAAGGDWFATYKEIIGNCNYTITVNWKQAKKVVVTMVFAKDTTTVTIEYTLKIQGTAPASLGIHLCGENSTVTFETVTVG